MAKEPEKPQEAAEQTEEKKKQPSKLFKGPMLLVIIGVGGFIVAIVAFSLVMGVFSASKGTPEAGKNGDSTAVAEAPKTGGDSLEGHSAAGSPPEATKGGTTALDSMETAIFGDGGIRSATNMDDIVALAGKNGKTAEKPNDSTSGKPSSTSEWAKLDAEKKQLDARKKEMDDQEARLKQLLSKSDQLESARIGSLAKLYDGMNPQQVAPLITKLTDDQAVDVLLKMKPSNAAKVLEALTAERAARISAKMITVKDDVDVQSK
jgi:flagellar motility protein MotE (MotC chaperone)